MNLASHNSMSYLKPKKWYLYPWQFMARCQSKTIEEQFEKYNIRYFDLRIRFKNTVPEFAHGSMTYKGNVNDVLRYLNSKAESIQIRLLLETSKADDTQESLFRDYCSSIQKEFPNLIFHNGRRKFDWKIVYQFPNPEPSLDQKVSSMTWKIWDDWCPYLYARLMNKKNIKQGTDKDYLMIDFLHIQ